MTISTQIQVVFYGLGIAYCIYNIAFRWADLRKKYGRLDLVWWLGAVMFVFSLAGWLVAVAVWLVQRQISN